MPIRYDSDKTGTRAVLIVSKKTDCFGYLQIFFIFAIDLYFSMV